MGGRWERENAGDDVGGRGVVRGGVQFYCIIHPVDSFGRAGTGPCGREKPPGQPGAAVHRHTLDRVNAINDSLKIKKKAPGR